MEAGDQGTPLQTSAFIGDISAAQAYGASLAVRGYGKVTIFDYASPNAFKHWVSEWGDHRNAVGAGYADIHKAGHNSGMWVTLAPITSIQLFTSNLFAQGFVRTTLLP